MKIERPKIERPTIWTPPEPEPEAGQGGGSIGGPPGAELGEILGGKTSATPVELPRNPSAKTDSVEMKEGSNTILDKIASAPKLDPSQVNLDKGNEVPAALIPGIPFREKAELPKTLPNGTSVDSGVGSGDLGFGKTRPGPNHMGIDLKGNDIRNQLNDALNLKEGGGVQSSTPPAAGNVNYNDLGDKRPEAPKYEAGFNRPGMGLVSADKNGNTTKDDLQGLVPQAGIIDRFVNWWNSDKKPEKSEAQKQIEERMEALKKQKEATDGGTKKYTNPDAPGGAPVVTQETLEKVQLRRDSTTQPGVQEDVGPIDSSKLSEADPRLKLISNPNPDDQSTGTPAGNPGVILDVKGPDKDPELAGEGEPIVFDPNRPKP